MRSRDARFENPANRLQPACPSACCGLNQMTRLSIRMIRRNPWVQWPSSLGSSFHCFMTKASGLPGHSPLLVRRIFSCLTVIISWYIAVSLMIVGPAMAGPSLDRICAMPLLRSCWASRFPRIKNPASAATLNGSQARSPATFRPGCFWTRLILWTDCPWGLATPELNSSLVGLLLG